MSVIVSDVYYVHKATWLWYFVRCFVFFKLAGCSKMLWMDFPERLGVSLDLGNGCQP